MRGIEEEVSSAIARARRISGLVDHAVDAYAACLDRVADLIEENCDTPMAICVQAAFR